MFPIAKFIFFVLTVSTFGFASISQVANLRTLVYLIPLSISFGISAYIVTCHIVSFFTGPQLASTVSLFSLFFITLVILIVKYKTLFNAKLEITKNQLLSIWLVASSICVLTFLAIYRIGPFDKDFHIPLALTMYHNNVYPPRDFYRPDYPLIYHWGGDLLAISIHHICKLDIYRSFELILAILSGATFLSFFALAWILTKNYKLSLISTLCTYFGGGLLYVDAILRYLFKTLPESANNWGFLQTFVNLGIHGSILNPPSVHAFLSTSGIGYPVLILSFILLWKMIEENNLKINAYYITLLNVSLLSLFLSAEWLYVTFFLGVLPFSIIFLLQKQKRILISILILLVSSITLSKTIGTATLFQNELQSLGRANILNVALKENLFTITCWSRFTEHLNDYRLISFFSWDFISEFGFSLLLFPIALIYALKAKSKLSLLLFLGAITTMPVPLFIDFKTNPVDLNRFFAFGNTIIILLISCGIGTLYKPFLQKNILILIYLFIFCLSPISGLFVNAVFTAYVSSSKQFSQSIFEELKRVRSLSDLQTYFHELDKVLFKIKFEPINIYTDELNFLKLNSKPLDVAISSFNDVPLYGGVYTIIPANVKLYKDQVYSTFDNIHYTTLKTLDPYLLQELNIRWILISNTFKDKLPKETKDALNNQNLFQLAYVSKEQSEIYHVKELKEHLKHKTAWLLVNSKGEPVELTLLQGGKITLFDSLNNALLYLKHLYNMKKELKKELIIPQATIIESLEDFIKTNNLNVTIEKEF